MYRTQVVWLEKQMRCTHLRTDDLVKQLGQ